MKSEIKIILEEGASNKAKGNCFENLIRNILATHHYKIRGNINFSGMEIDLIAEHKHKNEILYVECKAKEKVTSDELSKFCFNTFHKKADGGYFFRTSELEFQAGALLSDIRSDERYKNLTFFEPDNIIQILSDAELIFEPHSKLSSFEISKKILAVTYFGDYFIYLINESNLLPTKLIIIDAKSNYSLIDDKKIQLIKDNIEEIRSLTVIENTFENPSVLISSKNEIFETISEVQESENWYDYLPASSENKHFVGRDSIRTQILEYFKEMQTNKSIKRIFYLNGKSGWGKSSLVLEIKGRCRNKHYKNKFFTVAIDTRSATSDNFVALSFDKLIQAAHEQNFIEKSMFDMPVSFTSNTDLLSSDSVKLLLQKLESENKFLVLIFDQFEDVFRKKNLFKSFYKFLSDVTDKKPNIIVGFSWKTEIIIPIEHEAYTYWHQSKEQAKEFTISDFGEKEIDGIIKQLEDSIGRIDKEVKNRIKENSQGLPWFTKKLCIHIYEQIQSGLKKDKLIESNLNIKDLFEKDKEQIGGVELKALKHIAQKAYDGNFFDVSEVNDSIDDKTIEALIHKRLIIRSGANYNIYWDIFRDYLVTNIIPPIGESYLLRQGVNLCLEVFLLFENPNKNETVESLLEKHSKDIGRTTLENILLELRNFGLVQKNEEYYKIAKNNIDVSKEGFIRYTTEKFQNYTPYLTLKKLNLPRISKEDVVIVLKNTFKQTYKDKTWDFYSKFLIGWFLLSNIDIKSKIIEPKKGRGIGATNTVRYSKLIPLSENTSILPSRSLNEVSKALSSFNTNSYTTYENVYRDLRLLGIIGNKKELTDFGKELLRKDESNRKSILREKVCELPKMKELKKLISSNPNLKIKDIIQILPNDFFNAQKFSSKKSYAKKALSWLRNN